MSDRCVLCPACRTPMREIRSGGIYKDGRLLGHGQGLRCDTCEREVTALAYFPDVRQGRSNVETLTDFLRERRERGD